MTTIENRPDVVENPYLEGYLAPVDTEITVEAADLEVTGSIPGHLDGRYLRNGSNPVGKVNPAIQHWFLGDAMVHGLALRDGKAQWYRNRLVRTPAVSRVLGERPVPGLDPRAGMLGVGPNTNVLTHAGQTLALVEGGGAQYRLTEDLDTLGTCDFGGTLFGGYTAHPHRDPRTGELHAVSYSAARGHTVQYSIIDTTGRARRTVDVEVTGSPMMHDFSLTDDYVVIYDLPVTFDAAEMAPGVAPKWLQAPVRLALQALVGRVRVPDALTTRMNAETRRPARMPFSWNEKYPARIGVMSRSAVEDGGQPPVRWFQIEPCYVFHPLNAYTEDRAGHEILILDVIRHDRMFDQDRRGPGESSSTLDRWEIDLAAGSVHTETRDDRGQEFPRINEALTGARHRFGYTVGLDGGFGGGKDLRTAVYKHDYNTGAAQSAALPDRLWIGEMVFVENPNARAEDDGVLLGYGLDRESDRGQLLILDAPTLETRATVQLPQRIPMGFHGNWCPR